MDQPVLDEKRLRAVRASFKRARDGGGDRDAFYSELQVASVELERVLSIKPLSAVGLSVARARALNVALRYLNSRLNDLLVREVFVQWLRSEFVRNSGRSDQLWNSFARLVVKDFHTDVSSLMDAVSPVAILLDTDLKRKDQRKLPGFADIQKGTDRSYRAALSPDTLGVVDATNEWWPFVKEVRDITAHRQHSRVVFADAGSGFLFQVYQDGTSPLVTSSPLAAETGTNVSDFLLYSAWVTAEVFYLLDNLGHLLVSRLGLDGKKVITIMGEGDFGEFLDHLDELIAKLGRG